MLMTGWTTATCDKVDAGHVRTACIATEDHAHKRNLEMPFVTSEPHLLQGSLLACESEVLPAFWTSRMLRGVN